MLDRDDVELALMALGEGMTHAEAAELCGRPDAAESAKYLYQNNGRTKLETPFRLVNCHLGGSSSVCGNGSPNAAEIARQKRFPLLP